MKPKVERKKIVLLDDEDSNSSSSSDDDATQTAGASQQKPARRSLPAKPSFISSTFNRGLRTLNNQGCNDSLARQISSHLAVPSSSNSNSRRSTRQLPEKEKATTVKKEKKKIKKEAISENVLELLEAPQQPKSNNSSSKNGALLHEVIDLEVEALTLSKATTTTTTTTNSRKTRSSRAGRRSKGGVAKEKTKEKVANNVAAAAPVPVEMEEVICMSDGEETVVMMPRKRTSTSPTKNPSPPKTARTRSRRSRGGAAAAAAAAVAAAPPAPAPAPAADEIIILDDSGSSPEEKASTSTDSSLNGTLGNLSLVADNSLNFTFNSSSSCSAAKAPDTPIDLKMKRLNTIKTVTILQGQPLTAAFDQISALFNVPTTNIVLYYRDEMVDPHQTPLSLGLTIADILELMFRSSAAAATEDGSSSMDTFTSAATDTGTTTTSDQPQSADPNFVTLHFRDNAKGKVTLRCNRFQSLRSVAEQYARERGVSLQRVVFEFDCEPMAFSKLVDAFDLEDDDQIDVLYR